MYKIINTIIKEIKQNLYFNKKNVNNNNNNNNKYVNVNVLMVELCCM